MIYTIGNSHAHIFTNTAPGYESVGYKYPFKSISIGPTIAYNFYENHYPIVLKKMEELNVQKNDYIILVVGEVDCRWHLPYQSMVQNKNVWDLTKECIDRFYRCHIDLKARGYNVLSWGNHPSNNNEQDNPNSPIFGNVQLRNKISKLWNDYLEHKSKEDGILHISIFNELMNEDGTTKMEYFSDYCHLNYFMVKDLIFEKFKVITNEN